MRWTTMAESERHFEIDVRPVIDPAEYQRLIDKCGGQPSQKVYVKPRNKNMNKTDVEEEGTVFDQIQYWYPEGEFQFM